MGSRSVETVDVAIIGAGWYGLVAARTYLRLQPNVKLLIIDSDTTVGGVWSEDRLYPNLVAQVNLGLFNYTDTAMPAAGVTNKNQVTGKMIHDYLQKYAEDHDLLRHIQFNSHVERAERCSRGWRLQLKNSTDVIETEKLMVATGVTSIASMPEFTPIDVTVPIIHSKDLGASFEKIKKEKIKRVVVVGAAKSAYDAVYLLLSMGKRVTWIIRPEGSGPLAILPSELLGLWTSIGVASTRLMTNLSPSIFNTEGILYSFFQKSLVGRWLTGKFWDAVSSLSDAHAGYSKGDHVGGLRPEIDGKSIFWANSGLGVVTLPNFWEVIHQGDVTIVRDELNIIKKAAMVLKSGRTIQSDYIVMCTGWGDHFAMFDDETKVEVGLPVLGKAALKKTPRDPIWDKYDYDANLSVNKKLPFLAKGPVLNNPKNNQVQQRKWRLYRRVVPLELAEKGDRSLVILGQIHTVQTPLVSEMQSFWAILYLLGELNLPDKVTMAKEIAEWNAWTRKRYLSQGQKFPYSLYDFLPYVDTLCKDLNINSRRKPNVVAEYFSPYRPEDFNGFIDEYLSKKSKETQRSDGLARIGNSRAFWFFFITMVTVINTVYVVAGVNPH
ncbi:putative dimethylaniline monooxygenase [Tricladium varicosporioides]|nr:putative dimethylaniline monooxygenase [Hymenoscyphus varicosporioides]